MEVRGEFGGRGRGCVVVGLQGAGGGGGGVTTTDWGAGGESTVLEGSFKEVPV